MFPTTIKGRFVRSVETSWGAFKGEDGREIPAGKKLLVTIYDEQRDDLREIDCRDTVAAVAPLTFGASVEVDCEVTESRRGNRFRATDVRRGTELKAAPAAPKSKAG